MSRLTPLTLTLLCLLGSAHAATPRTLEQSIELASHHPLLAQKQGELEAAKGGQQAAHGAQWFKLTGDAEFGVQTYDQPGNDANTGVANGGLGISQPLIDGGRRSATAQETDERLDEATHNLAWQERLQKFQAVEAHTNLWLAGKLRDMTDQDTAFLMQITSSTEQRFTLKDATKTEVAEAQSRLESAKTLQDQRRADVGIARGNYIRAVGETVTDVADPSPSITAVPVQGVHPLVQAAQAARDEARARVSQKEAADWPTANLLGSVRRDQYDGIDRNEKTTSGKVVVSLGYTFWDSGVTRGEKAEARGNLRAADAELQATELEVASQRTAAASRWQHAEQRLRNGESALHDATITVQLLVREVQMGNRTLRELLDAQRDMTAAMTTWLQAYAARTIAWYDLQRWQ